MAGRKADPAKTAARLTPAQGRLLGELMEGAFHDLWLRVAGNTYKPARVLEAEGCAERQSDGSGGHRFRVTLHGRAVHKAHQARLKVLERERRRRAGPERFDVEAAAVAKPLKPEPASLEHLAEALELVPHLMRELFTRAKKGNRSAISIIKTARARVGVERWRKAVSRMTSGL